MPAFYLLVILMAIFIWFCCIQYYEPIGKWLRDWFDETKEIMTKDENDDEAAKNSHLYCWREVGSQTVS